MSICYVNKVYYGERVWFKILLEIDYYKKYDWGIEKMCDGKFSELKKGIVI